MAPSIDVWIRLSSAITSFFLIIHAGSWLFAEHHDIFRTFHDFSRCFVLILFSASCFVAEFAPRTFVLYTPLSESLPFLFQQRGYLGRGVCYLLLGFEMMGD